MIIGISGALGSGKDTCAEYIEQTFGYKHVSGGDLLRAMLTQIGFEPKKGAVSDLGVLLRRNYGPDAMLKLVVNSGGSSNIVNSGFRSPEEAKLIKESGGIIIFIEASQKLRHERVLARSRADDADINLVLLDDKEAKSNDMLADSLEDVRIMSDFIIANDSSLESLYAKIDAIFLKIST